MKLIDLLVKELPRRGGWPGGAEIAVQDADSQICFSSHSDVYTNKGQTDWYGGDWGDGDWSNPFIDTIADDRHECIVSRKQYEAALAASKAVVGHNGWIQWAGGECPVDGDAVVEVKYRKPTPYQYNNDRAGDFSWAHDGIDGDIIAYRLHRDINYRANDDRLEQDLNECFGQGVDMPEWDGKGLPPVGCECEVKRAIDWVKCKILFISEAHVVLMADEECCWNTCACQFRPLRTESERKRDAAINDMLTIIDCNGVDPKNSAIQIYEAIAAGKIPGVKLEGK